MLELIGKVSGVPAGSYKLKFKRLEPFESDRYEDPAIRWSFEVVGGDRNGAETSRITQAEPTKLNACGRMVKAILGVPQIEAGANYNFDSCVDAIYLGQVAETESGATRVETVIKSD